MFSKDLVQYQTFRAPSVSEEEMTQEGEPRASKNIEGANTNVALY
jgi:hypothetical protein